MFFGPCRYKLPALPFPRARHSVDTFASRIALNFHRGDIPESSAGQSE